jgi:predicted transcriptional regulator
MNKTVELVNEWAVYEAKNPKASIDDFCKYRLTLNKELTTDKKLFNGLLPPNQNTILSKLVYRIARLNRNFSELALKNVDIKQLEDFIFLSTIANLKNPKKTDVIYSDVTELSTGLLILERLKKQGYILEKGDVDDKRSKRVSITKKGEKILLECYAHLQRASEMVYFDMEPEHITLCIQLLQHVDIKLSEAFHKHKTDSFPEIYRALTGKKFEKAKIERRFD